MSKTIIIQLENRITFKKSDLSEWLIAQIRKYLTMANPVYLDLEKHGRDTHGVNKFIYAYEEKGDLFYSSRGYMGNLITFLQRNGYQYRIIDDRRRLPDVDFTFNGDLRGYQIRAVNDVLKKDFAVLVAPCGSGKTVMACRIIADRKQQTIVIVHTKELLNQWVERISHYLDISKGEVGIIGSGKEIIKPITVGMVQTLGKRDLDEIREHFGFLIVDECQHCPASTFLNVASAFDSQYMLGLSASPYRRDRLNILIFLSLGNVAAEVKDCDLQDAGIRIKPEIIVRQTEFDFDYKDDSDYQPMISALVEDTERNEIIVEDVLHELENYSLVFSDRKSHLNELSGLLTAHGVKSAILTGDVPKKQREQVIRDLDTGLLHVVLATGQLAGEGLDIPRLNRIFVTTPIKWKGRLVQYIGRVLRTAKGKIDAKIYDYRDIKKVILEASFKSRERIYEAQL